MGEHYNSVRLQEDPCNGPALPIGHDLNVRQLQAAKDKEDSSSKAPEENKGLSSDSTNGADFEELPNVFLNL
jgi:hypothetical protein